jgi:putative addiction module antidote
MRLAMTRKDKGFDEKPAAFAGEKAQGRGDVLKVRKIGNSLGVVLPKELLAKLRVAEGDELSVVETPNGLELSRSNDEFEEHMRLVEEIMKRYPNTLRALAK